VNAGDTLVAVAETRNGVFGWASPTASVWYNRHMVLSSEFNAGYYYPTGNQVPIPAPGLITATSSSVQLQWAGMPDPTNAISSYSIYRATYAPNPATATLPTGALWDVAPQAGTVTYIDNAVSANTTYYYTIAPNFKWGFSSGNIGLGANPNKPYYTTLGQSYATVATTQLYPASYSASWQVPIGATTGQYFTVILNVANSGDVASNGPVVPSTNGTLVVSGTTIPQVLPGPSPLSVGIPAHGSAGFTYTVSPSANGMVSFSATAIDGGGVSVTAGSAAVSISQAAQLNSFFKLSGSLIYLVGTIGDHHDHGDDRVERGRRHRLGRQPGGAAQRAGHQRRGPAAQPGQRAQRGREPEPRRHHLFHLGL
jgi:hypothetical protein